MPSCFRTRWSYEVTTRKTTGDTQVIVFAILLRGIERVEYLFMPKNSTYITAHVINYGRLHKGREPREACTWCKDNADVAEAIY